MPVDDVIPMVRPDGNMRTLAEIEAAAIDYALLAYRSRCAAADALGISRATLYRRIQDYAANHIVMPCESSVRSLGVDLEDALALSEGTDV